MNMHGSRLLGLIFWVTYLIAALACWLTTYQVFAQSDTPLVAGLAAASIDGVLALTLYLMGRTSNQDQRATALVGTFVFGIFSGFAQVIHRFDGLGLVMPEWMKIVSLFLLPMSTTGGLVLLGVIKYFSHGNKQNQGGGKQNQGGHQDFGQFQRPRQEFRDTPERLPTPSDLGLRAPAVQGNGNGTRKFGNERDSFPRLVPQDNPTPPEP